MARRAAHLKASAILVMALATPGRAQEAVRIEGDIVVTSSDGTPIVATLMLPAALDGGPVYRRIDLHGIAWRLEPGHVLELEVTTGSTQYAAPRTGPFAVSMTATVDLPVLPG
jgi:hypothetical protein